GQPLVVGGDVLLSVQGMTVVSNEDMVKVLKSLETLKEGDDLQVTVLRDKKVQPLGMKWTGWVRVPGDPATRWLSWTRYVPRSSTSSSRSCPPRSSSWSRSTSCCWTGPSC